MSWLKFIFSNWKKITKINVEYSLITKSGNEILDAREVIIPEKLIIGNYGEYDWKNWEKDILKIYEKDIQIKAENLLNNLQEKQRRKINQGILDGGDYIVKCEWDIFKESDWISYKEYKKWIKKKL
jgi:hypothetical protein